MSDRAITCDRTDAVAAAGAGAVAATVAGAMGAEGAFAAAAGTLAGFAAVFTSGGSSGPGGAAKATAMISGVVQKQAAMLAFLDNYKMLGVVFLMVLPVMLLLKKPKGAVNAPVH